MNIWQRLAHRWLGWHYANVSAYQALDIFNVSRVRRAPNGRLYVRQLFSGLIFLDGKTRWEPLTFNKSNFPKGNLPSPKNINWDKELDDLK